MDEPGPTAKRQLAKAAEESDESQGWLEFIQAAELLQGAELKRLYEESTELAAIFSASVQFHRRPIRRSYSISSTSAVCRSNAAAVRVY